ncbi:MAG: hypothetical protein WC330_04085, partial [Candidatus Omnitrophota bacterium]
NGKVRRQREKTTVLSSGPACDAVLLSLGLRKPSPDTFDFKELPKTKGRYTILERETFDSRIKFGIHCNLQSAIN